MIVCTSLKLVQAVSLTASVYWTQTLWRKPGAQWHYSSHTNQG